MELYVKPATVTAIPNASLALKLPINKEQLIVIYWQIVITLEDLTTQILVLRLIMASIPQRSVNLVLQVAQCVISTLVSRCLPLTHKLIIIGPFLVLAMGCVPSLSNAMSVPLPVMY